MVSVILPVYNVEDYLEECLCSLRDQSLKNFEVIAVNDGSTDGSLKILEDFRTSNPLLKLNIISQFNQGLSEARNTGLTYCNGDYVLFMDSDDWISHDYLELLYSTAIAFESDIVLTDFIRTKGKDDQGTINKGYLANSPCIPFNGEKNALIEYLNCQIVIVAWNKLIRKSLIVDNGFRFPGGVWYEDIPMVKLFYYAKRFDYVKSTYYYYRQREGSITKTVSTRIYEKYRVLIEVKEFLELEGLRVELHAVFNKFYGYTAILEIINSLIVTGSLFSEEGKKIKKFFCNTPEARSLFKNMFGNKFMTLTEKLSILLINRFLPLYYLAFKVRLKLK